MSNRNTKVHQAILYPYIIYMYVCINKHFFLPYVIKYFNIFVEIFHYFNKLFSLFILTTSKIYLYFQSSLLLCKYNDKSGTSEISVS